MASEERVIYVYDDFSYDEPVLLGRLYVGVIKHGETYSFEYDKEWLTNNKMSISLDPEIQPFLLQSMRLFIRNFSLNSKKCAIYCFICKKFPFLAIEIEDWLY